MNEIKALFWTLLATFLINKVMILTPAESLIISLILLTRQELYYYNKE